MTGRETPLPDAVRHLLDEAGIVEDPALVRAVETIGGLGAGPAPEVTAELAQLMADGGKAPPARRNKRRITFIGGALAVSMGVGMSGVAAGTAFTDGLTEVVESIARFSIRDDADRAHPLAGVPAEPEGLPGVLAVPDDGGRGVVAPEEIPAPSHAAPALSVVASIPAPGRAVGDQAAAGSSTAGTGRSVVPAAPRAPLDAVRWAVGDARSAAVPPAAVPAAWTTPSAAGPAPAVPPAVIPPEAAPRASAPPVAPTESTPAPGRERRSAPAPNSPPMTDSVPPGSHVPEVLPPGTPVPGNEKAGGPVPGGGETDDQALGSGQADAPGLEVRLLRQAQPAAPTVPGGDPWGKVVSSPDRRAPTAPDRVWFLAPAPAPGPAVEPVVEEPVDQPAPDQPAADQPVAERLMDQPVVEQAAADQPVVEQAAADQPAADQPVVEESVDQPAADQAAVDQPGTDEPARGTPANQPAQDRTGAHRTADGQPEETDRPGVSDRR
ncbi:hypothetical protein [Arthrobacter sp. TMS2-4]